MRRCWWRRSVAVALLASAEALASAGAITGALSLVDPSAASAASAICPPLKGRRWHASFGSRSGTRYQWSVVGNAFTCKTAKPWVAKLVDDRIGSSKAGNVRLRNGPRGYHCFATLRDRDGYAHIGMCYSGTLAYPTNGFQWAGS